MLEIPEPTTIEEALAFTVEKRIAEARKHQLEVERETQVKAEWVVIPVPNHAALIEELKGMIEFEASPFDLTSLPPITSELSVNVKKLFVSGGNKKSLMIKHPQQGEKDKIPGLLPTLYAVSYIQEATGKDLLPEAESVKTSTRVDKTIGLQVYDVRRGDAPQGKFIINRWYKNEPVPQMRTPSAFNPGK